MILTNEIRSAEEKGLNRKRLLQGIQMDGYTFSHKVEHWGDFSEQESKAILFIIRRFEKELSMLSKSAKNQTDQPFLGSQ